MSEFEIINRYFSNYHSAGAFNLKGDDCAIISTPSDDSSIVTSIDLLLEGQHFFSNVEPTSLGHKALAVNLSDLAAMGAKPLGCLLGLGLPNFNKEWLSKFSKGFNKLSKRYMCPLIGGDTTSHSNNSTIISVTVFGAIYHGKMLRRDSARVGDEIWVSGTMGAADIAYRLLSNKMPTNPILLSQTRKSLEWPNIRLELGQFLIDSANSAIDISDGLLQDLQHILNASQVGAYIQYESIPISSHLSGLPDRLIQESVLNGGDVYELCFTAAPGNHGWIMKKSKELGIPVNVIGFITDEKKQLKVVNSDGSLLNYSLKGFDHFFNQFE